MNQRVLQVVAVGLIISLIFFMWPRNEGAETDFAVGGVLTVDYGDGTEVQIYSKNVATDPWEQFKQNLGLNVLSNPFNGKNFDANSRMKLETVGKWTVKPDNSDGSNRKSNVQYWVNSYITVNGKFISGTRSYTPVTGFQTNELSSWIDTKNTNYWNSLDLTGTSGFIPTYYQERGSGLQTGNVNWGIPAIQMAHPLEEAMKGVPLVGSAAQAAATALAHTEVTNNQEIDLLTWNKAVYEFHIDLGRINWEGLAFNIGSVSFGAGTYTRLSVGDTYTIGFHMNYIYRFQDVTGEWSAWKGGSVELFTFKTTVREGTYTTVGFDPLGGYSLWG